MVSFSSSPAFGNAQSYSCNWPSRYQPADDGSCAQNVAVQVLEQYDIPFIGGAPPLGRLCGLDINNMQAQDAIQLSLAENMKNGEFWEVYTDANGFAYFQQVYPSPEIADIEIRTCIPTSNIDQKADLVIVRGYDSPPCRSFKDFVSVDWLEVDSLYYYTDHCPEFSTEAWRCYKDPVLETAYKDGAENLYELKAFEQLVGYVIDFDGVVDPNIKYSFSETCLKNVPLPLTAGNRISGSTEICNTDRYTKDTINYTGITYKLGNFTETDKFGDPWPLFLNVQGIYATVFDVISANLVPLGNNIITAHIIIDPKKKFVSIPASNWHWTLNSDSSPSVHFYYRTPSPQETNAFVGEAVLRGWSWSDEWDLLDRSPRSPGKQPEGILVPNLGGGWVNLVTNMFAVVELDRPSVHVSDPNGNAIGLAYSFNLSYQPIIITDEPAPVAYTFGGGARLVDHTLDLYDADPSTQQDPPSLIEGSLSWLQSQTTGRTVDISLPFCSESECTTVADTIFSLQNENITSYAMVCGPTKHPKLGTRVPGYEGRINRITYSYTDSSAYLINVTVGPTFANARGWGTSIWQRKTEDVSREAIVVWAAGDGVNYRVKVQGGLGVYHAVNKTMGAYVPGEKVKVTIHNNPVEK